jgi:hypothetical protein
MPAHAADVQPDTPADESGLAEPTTAPTAATPAPGVQAADSAPAPAWGSPHSWVTRPDPPRS